MDKELEAIVKIEELLKDMKWGEKQRIINFVQSRFEWEPLVDGGGLVTDQSALNQATGRV